MVRAGAQAVNQARASGAVGISLRLGVTGRLRGPLDRVREAGLLGEIA